MPIQNGLAALLCKSQLLARTTTTSKQLRGLAVVLSEQTRCSMETIEILLGVFSPRGNDTGLIKTAKMAGRIISNFTRRDPGILQALEMDETGINRLVEALGRFEDSPHSSDELDAFSDPILFAHQKISGAPSWELFVEQWHRAAIARYEQLAPVQLTNRVWAERFTEFLRVPARIIKALQPEECAQIIEFPDELVDLGIETIKRLNGYSRWSPQTRQTYANRWRAFVDLAPARRKFDTRPSPGPNTIPLNNLTKVYANWLEADAADGLAQPEVIRFSQAAQAQHDLDNDELTRFQQSELTATKSTHRIDSRSPELISHPSNRSPGVHSPRLIAHYLQALELLFPEGGLAYWRARAMFNLALHTGLSARHISEIEIVHSVPNREPNECPAYLPKAGALIWSPCKFLGRPDALQPSTALDNEAYLAKIAGLQQSYAPVADIIKINLPNWLANEINHYLVVAEQTGSHPNSGRPLFSLSRRPEVTWHDLASLCKNLHPYVEDRIPSIPPLTPGLMSITFEGLYATQGLDPIYRYYLNLRQRHHLLLPVWYCRVWMAELARAYHATSEAIQKAISGEYQLVTGRTLSAPDLAELPRRLSDGYVGNMRCPTANFISRLNRFILTDGWFPWNSPGLTDEQRRFNCSTAQAALILLELTGLRPFELTRLRFSMLDLSDVTLAVEGKAHRAGGMGRLIPLAPALVPWLIHLHESSPHPTRSATPLFRLYDAFQDLRSVTADDIQKALDNAASIFADKCPAPDAYSFRRLARSEALEAGLPFDIANYLLGHQSAGGELFNPHLEYDWAQVVRESRRLQHHIASKYELALEPGPT